MVAASVDIPGLLGASQSVSNPNQYFEIFRRVFSALNMPNGLESVKAYMKSSFSQDVWPSLEALFDRRHTLIHEVTSGQVGPWSLREHLALIEVKEAGTTVLALMKEIERSITAHAPREFPNKLTIEGYAENENEYLESEIDRLENEIRKVFLREVDEFPEDNAIAWQSEVTAWKKYLTEGKNFLESYVPPAQRYFDYRSEMVSAALKGRLQYLRKVAENFAIDD